MMNAGQDRDPQHVKDIFKGWHTSDDKVRASVVPRLKALEREWLLRVLRDFVKESPPELRCDAALALMKIDPNEAFAYIAPMFSDTDDNVRWWACGLFQFQQGDKRAIQQLMRVVKDDPVPEVRYAAAFVLGEMGDVSAIPVLRQVVESDKGEDYEGRLVWGAAQEAIEKILARES